MIEAIILKYQHLWCVIAYCFMFATKECKNKMMLLHIDQPKSKAKDKQTMVTNLQIHDRKQRLPGTHRGEIYWKVYIWWTQRNASEILRWKFSYYNFMLSDNSTACCSERLKHNLLSIFFFSINLLKLIHNFPYIYNRKKKKDRQSVTSFKSNMKQLKSADLTDHYNCNKYWVPNH